MAAGQNGQGGLAGVVRQEEAASGGDATPGAAAEERFGVEADEDLTDEDVV